MKKNPSANMAYTKQEFEGEELVDVEEEDEDDEDDFIDFDESYDDE